MNFRLPITPATTGPVLMPARTVIGIPVSARRASSESRRSRAKSATLAAWSAAPEGTPEAAM